MHNDSNSNSSDAVVSFRNVSKVYSLSGVSALTDASFSVAKGEFVIFVGPSGEGKSTILKLIARLEEPTSGTIVRPERVSMSFQSAALLPWLTVYENIALGLRAQNVPEKKTQEAVRTYIAMTNLTGLEDKFPPQLSGGQAQRVGIARALCVDPEVLLLDEPFSALDAKTTAELHDDLIMIWQRTHKTIIMVSHIVEEAVSLADRVLVVKKGKIADTIPITLPYPRREREVEFMHDVSKIRREFFKN